MLPTKNWRIAGIKIARVAFQKAISGCARTIGKGNNVAIAGPILGMKFRIKAMNPKRNDMSTPRIKSVNQTRKPVITDIMSLIVI